MTFRCLKDILGLMGNISKNKLKYTKKKKKKKKKNNKKKNKNVQITYITFPCKSLAMRRDKDLHFWNCWACIPCIFQRLCLWKVPLQLLEIWSKLYCVWKHEKEGWVWKTTILTNFKAVNCWEVPPNDKWIYMYFPTNTCKSSGQFENSVFVIVGK